MKRGSQFKTEQMTKRQVTKDIMSEKWRLLPMYMGQKVVRVWFSRIRRAYKEESVVAVIIRNIEEEYKTIST